MDPILITGGTGQIGSALLRLFDAAGVPALAPGRRDLNLADPDSIQRYLDRTAFSALFSCAAYTAVDRAEKEPGLAAAINARAPGILAAAACSRSVPILHVSTDYVFDGRSDAAYSEDAPTGPINTYGRTKLDGEEAVRAANAHYVILRTAWVLSADGANFLNTMLKLGAARQQIGVVNDQRGCPTSASDIAQALHAIWAQIGVRRGVWNFVNCGEASWFDLACFIFALARDRGLPTPEVRAIATADYPTCARRPANSCLSTARFERDFGYRPRSWQDAVEAIMTNKFGQ